MKQKSVSKIVDEMVKEWSILGNLAEFKYNNCNDKEVVRVIKCAIEEAYHLGKNNAQEIFREAFEKADYAVDGIE